jgi:polyribonucleotide nucleotidyltransferase
VKVGDKLRVEIADIDNRGKISLVLVAEEVAEKVAEEVAEEEKSQTPDAAPTDAAHTGP